MPAVDPRLRSALRVQLGEWQRSLGAGARRVGWKIGAGDAERIGPGPVIGHLTTATQLQPGAVFRADDCVALHADAEVAVELGRDVDAGAGSDGARDAIAGFGAALELVDLGAHRQDPQAIVAANVFHRAFALAPVERSLPANGAQGRLIVNGRVRATGTSAPDFADAVLAVATLLEAMGEQLRAGDRLITGSVVQLPVERGDDVLADFGALGRVALAVAP